MEEEEKEEEKCEQICRRPHPCEQEGGCYATEETGTFQKGLYAGVDQLGL